MNYNNKNPIKIHNYKKKKWEIMRDEEKHLGLLSKNALIRRGYFVYNKTPTLSIE